MGFFSMVVLIVLIGAITSVLTARYRALERNGTARSDGDAARDEVRRLSERVAVLERVITDGRPGMDLDREIERLRDRPRPGAARELTDRREQA